MTKVLYYLFTCLVWTCTFVSSDHARRTRGADDEQCSHSPEAKQSGLFEFFEKIQSEYYSLQPYLISTHIGLSGSDVKKFYKPYDPSPDMLKRNSEKAQSLLKELNSWKLGHDKLKPREARLIHQFRYFLQSNFDSIYEHYFDGVWLLGPDYFCEQPICSVLSYFHQALSRMEGTIRSLKDLKDLISLVKSHKNTFEQYLKNIKQGVKSGMVWSEQVCKASAKTFGKTYRAIRKEPSGALKMRFAKFLLDISQGEGLYKNLDIKILADWKQEHDNIDFAETLRNEIIQDIGVPLNKLIKYLKTEHVTHCPPSNVASGLGKLPLDYIYNDGEKTSEATTKTMPSGDDIQKSEQFDVKKGYENFFNYYTSGEYTGKDASKLGHQLIEKYYKEVEELAIEITGNKNKEEAVSELKKMTESGDVYIEGEIPENESDDNAHEECDDDESAQKNCPNRWEAYNKWKERNVDIMKEAKPYLQHLFHQDGDKKTTPDCLVSIVPDYDPTNGVPSYLESDPDCSAPAQYFLPFFKEKMGPLYDDYNTNFHEARPGHHLQIQGYLENFMDECEDISMWLNNLVDYYPAFSEGWGLYAENPLLLENAMDDILKKKESERLSKYGALKWQIWRALRLVVDVGFHQNEMTRDEALKLFLKYTWDSSDTVHKELTRYQGTPGQATSYTLGQQTILELRHMAKKELKDGFDIKDFHYQLLSVGQAPYEYVKIHIKNYIQCKKDKNSLSFCNTIDGKRNTSRKRGGVFLVDPIKEKRQKLVDNILRNTRHKKYL